MKWILTFLLVTPTWAQTVAPSTVTIPPLTIQIPAIVLQPMTFSCPVNGKTANCKTPQTTLATASQASTTKQTLNVVDPPTMVITITCTGPLTALACTAKRTQ